jgi:tRNA1(Val) A37 N6-methylase TrmN6
VLPYSESKVFLQVADGHGFRLQKRQLIFPKPCKEPNRVNLQLGLETVETLPEEKFIIRNEEGTFSDQYKKLLGGYYTSIKG